MSSVSLPIGARRPSAAALSFYSGVFCITAATLMLQIIETRILSVQAWYHLAFFVISSAMFGLTLGAVWVYLRGARFTEKTLSHDLAYFSAAFAISTVISLVVQMSLPLFLMTSITALAVWLQMALCLAVPFFFSGIVVSLALTRSPFPIGRVYGVDLAGAAVGCIGVLVLLNLTDGPSAVLWVAVVAALGADLFLLAGIGGPPNPAPRLRLNSKYRGTLCLILVAWAVINGQDAAKAAIRPIFVKQWMELYHLAPRYVEWNSYSRIAFFDAWLGTPDMWGPSPRFSPYDWPIEQRKLNIDGDAGSTAYGLRGDLKKAEFLKYDITTLGYRLPDLERTAVIGVGGGRDLISARLFGVPSVLGIEINPIFVRLLQEHPEIAPFVGLDQIGGIELVVDEARNWFARSSERFDLIQMSLIDTYAATGAGAFTLSENGLYTVEAWRTFLRRLTSKGAFTVSRWHDPAKVDESGRVASLAVAALLEEGYTQPQRHIFLAGTDKIATLVLSREPFTPAALDKLEDTTKEMGFAILASPNQEARSPVLASIIASGSREALADATEGRLLDLSPTTDNRPFFFNQLPFDNIVKVVILVAQGRGSGVVGGNLLATYTLLLLLAISAGLVAATIIVPLRASARAVDRRFILWGSFYFLMIGGGFMLIEIALLQRFSVFLGHPVYSLSIVLFSIILATGIGSLISDVWLLGTRKRFILWSVMLATYVFGLTLGLPALLTAFESAQLMTRGLVCVSAIAPLGLLMGFGFPTGMRLIAEREPSTTPWFWGINGASGVMASTLAIGCSIAFGISTTLTIGALCYLLLIPAGLKIGFGKEPLPAGGVGRSTSESHA